MADIPVTSLNDAYYLEDLFTGRAKFVDGVPLVMLHKRMAECCAYHMNKEAGTNQWTVKLYSGGKPYLNVPYIPQWGPGADERPGDCGPADVAMLAHFLKDATCTVDQAAAACGQPVGGSSTGHADLIKGAKVYGITLKTRSKYRPPELVLSVLMDKIDHGLPSIALIHYGVLRDEMKTYPSMVQNQDQNYERGHWVLFIGYEQHSPGFVYVHDPDFWGDRAQDGNARKIPAQAFDKALASIAPGCTVGYQGLVVVE